VVLLALLEPLDLLEEWPDRSLPPQVQVIQLEDRLASALLVEVSPLEALVLLTQQVES
jgi:hypothetical protein